MSKLGELLRDTVRRGGSDLHFFAGEPPRMRHDGTLATVSGQTALTADDVQAELDAIMPETARVEFAERDGTDFAYSAEGIGRFRVNVLRHFAGAGAVFRSIPDRILPLDALGMPEVLASFCRQRNGLVLVTGKTGSGKSTTLAAMLDAINQERKAHIVTIEDPIEFIHARKRSLISQREVGRHAPAFATALRSALREDPDVIMVGELRDLETIQLAVTAAEMGILILATLHTSNASSTIDRLVNTFPEKQQAQVRNMLSTSLQAIVSQQLVPRTDGGRVAAVEVLINSHAVGNIIREGKTDQLDGVMRSGALVGMTTMDASLQRLVDGGLITPQEAWAAAVDKTRFSGAAGKISG